ncbi:hypothetical protein [Paenibacillus sp. 7541]|uniref:hypothetical protein n=1 Tax=Paenibacillus sp. 7541 TaxID=2026236 RepID=UPI0020D0DB6A|nr:hypothetical protein [Paenibacillus sp. 7541]
MSNPQPEQRARAGQSLLGSSGARRSLGLRRRKRKLYALLLSAILPGLGHLYLGLYRKGITFIMLLLLDISALLYFSSIGMQINVPLLILLGLLIPVGYFYNVYDALQAAEYMLSRRKREEVEFSQTPGKGSKNPFHGEQGAAFGLLLVVSGVLLILFHQKPVWLQTGIRDYGAVIAAVVLILIGVGAFIRELLRTSKREPKI